MNQFISFFLSFGWSYCWICSRCRSCIQFKTILVAVKTGSRQGSGKRKFSYVVIVYSDQIFSSLITDQRYQKLTSLISLSCILLSFFVVCQIPFSWKRLIYFGNSHKKSTNSSYFHNSTCVCSKRPYPLLLLCLSITIGKCTTRR